MHVVFMSATGPDTQRDTRDVIESKPDRMLFWRKLGELLRGVGQLK